MAGGRETWKSGSAEPDGGSTMEANETEGRTTRSAPWTFNGLIIVLAFVDLVIALAVSTGFSLGGFAFVGLFLIPAVIFTVLLLWRPKPWVHLAAGIAISYLFVVFIPFTIPALANPADPYAYGGTVLGLLSIAWSLPAGVLAFMQARKGRPQLSAREGWHSRQGIYSVGVALTSVAAYNYAASKSAGGAYDFLPQASVTVTAENFAFSPANFTVARQTLTEIVVVNKDSAFHTFTYVVGGTQYSHDLLPGSTTRFLVFFDSAGVIPFWCIPHQSSGMVGTITVPPPPVSRPQVTFSGVDLSASPGNATFAVAGVTQAVGPANYKVNLQIGTSAGTAVAMPTTGGNYVSVTVGSTVYRIYWTDIGGGNTINEGDQFRVSGNNVALTSGSYTFYLLWSDGSVIQTRTWSIA